MTKPETTNPVCNPFPAKKEKESKFVMTKPLVAEKRPVMSDPFLAEKPPHMFLNIFFAYQQKVESKFVRPFLLYLSTILKYFHPLLSHLIKTINRTC